MSTTKNDIKKILRDRKNHLKSELKQLETEKMDKRINNDIITMLKYKLDELEWIQKKLNR